MPNNTLHVFCSAMTVDGTPVNAVRTYDSRKISKLKREEKRDGSCYMLVDKKDLNAAWHDCIVYRWFNVSESE